MQGSPDSVALLDAWEAALSQPDVDRAPSLLVSLGWLTSDGALASSTVGETDRQLFGLRSALFGTRLDCVSTCPNCGEAVEFTTATHDIAPQQNVDDGEVVSLADVGVKCRRPANLDLHELAMQGGPIDSRRLLGRCLVGESTTLAALSNDQCDQALAALAQADPGASIEIAITCSCSHEWIDEFDIRSYLLAELTDWAIRSLRDVHQIASRYGWPESEILRMSPWRKSIYLEACGNS